MMQNILNFSRIGRDRILVIICLDNFKHQINAFSLDESSEQISVLR